MENYFNYFTEIEECYRRARGTPALLSTLDWALIESWKDAGIPLESVLRGIERAFEKYHKRPRRGRMVNSLAYCAQEVLAAAEETSADRAASPSKDRAAESPYSRVEVQHYFAGNARELRECAARLGGAHAADVNHFANRLDEIAGELNDAGDFDVEALERRLTVLEEQFSAALQRAASEELLVQIREEADSALARYRRAMPAAEIARLEQQFVKKRLFEVFAAPRLSLFYFIHYQ